jgi:hypothetical protein
MDRGIRSPVLMAVYLGIFLLAGPWFSIGGPPHRNFPQAALGIVLAVLVARGNRAARVMLILCSAAGVCAVLFGSHGSPAGAQLARLWYMACYLLQIGILVSTPVFQRTRTGWPSTRSARSSPAFLPAPTPWSIAASAAGGLLITIATLPVRHFTTVACPAGREVMSRMPCQAVGSGYPVAYRFDSGIFTLHAASFHWLDVLAPQGIQLAAFAADLVLWSLALLLVLYLAWLAPARERPPPRWRVAGPGPAASR